MPSMSQNRSLSMQEPSASGSKTAPASKASAKRKSRVNITVSDDILILRDVLGFNPFEDSDTWKNVAGNVAKMVSKGFTGRNVKDRVDYLMKQSAANFAASKRKTGTVDEYALRDYLLREVKDLRDSTVGCTHSAKKRAVASKEEDQSTQDASAPPVATSVSDDLFVTVKDEVMEHSPNVEENDPLLESCSASSSRSASPVSSATRVPVRWKPPPKSEGNADVDGYLRKKVEVELLKAQAEMKKQEVESRRLDFEMEKFRARAEEDDRKFRTVFAHVGDITKITEDLVKQNRELLKQNQELLCQSNELIRQNQELIKHNRELLANRPML